MTEENHLGQVIHTAFMVITQNSHAPYNSQQSVTQLSAQHHQADRRIGTRYQDENHHMVNFAEGLSGYALLR